jgi:probable O-glycosylation ligase (exosortase A-associated)
MRDLFLAPLLLAILFQTFRTPSTGILGWTWLTLMAPQKLIWGTLSSMPLNLILALATLPMVLFTRDKKKLSGNTVVVLWGLLTLMMTITTIFAITPAISWNIWNRVVKVMLLGILIPVLMTTPRRIHALIWVIVMCLGYFGVKGGVFTLFMGGGHVLGPTDSQLADNNNLALALSMSLPLMNYLRLQTPNHAVRSTMLFCMIATAFGVLGTFSRGGFIGLGVMAGYLWWKSKSRFTLAVGMVAVVVPAMLLMPQSWYERMGTLKDASNQTTFQTRWDAWTTNLNIALARPLTGGGFASSEDENTYRTYSYGRSMYADPKEGGFTGGHAAHSIYFEVLGDHGFIGFGLYFSLLASTLLMLRRVRRAARAIPSMIWAADLVTMMQVSFLAFFVSGTALSMAYYDLVYLFIGVALTLDRMVKEHKTSPVTEGQPPVVATASGKWRAPAHAAHAV